MNSTNDTNTPSNVLAGPDAQLFLEMMKRGGPGCMMGLMQAFRGKGMGEIFNSWMQENPQPITRDQLLEAMGKDQVAALAKMLGIPADEAAAKMASWMPATVKQLMPSH